MKKYVFCMIFLGVILIICLTGCTNQENNSQPNDANAERMQANVIDESNQVQKDVTEIRKNATENDEITIAEFSTKVYNKEEARQTNVRITCSKLNETIVKMGETFSFEAIVGKATSAERI